MSFKNLVFCLLFAFSQSSLAGQNKNLAKADEMIECMVYLLKYKYDDFYSNEVKANEAKAYEDAAIALSSSDYFQTRLFQLDDQLMVKNMAALGSRSDKETVAYYDGLITQCRAKQLEYQAQQSPQ
jgi:hypothetical protein